MLQKTYSYFNVCKNLLSEVEGDSAAVTVNKFLSDEEKFGRFLHNYSEALGFAIACSYITLENSEDRTSFIKVRDTIIDTNYSSFLTLGIMSYDQNQDGEVDQTELEKTLKNFSFLIQASDADKDGALNWNEINPLLYTLAIYGLISITETPFKAAWNITRKNLETIILEMDKVATNNPNLFV
jgi:hypothetical protein